MDVAIGLPNAVSGASGDRVGPSVAEAPELIVGGHADASFARAARFGDGWIRARAVRGGHRELGEQIAEFLVAGAAKDAEAIGQQIAAYDAAGCDELILVPCSADPDQVDLLAAAAGL